MWLYLQRFWGFDRDAIVGPIPAIDRGRTLPCDHFSSSQQCWLNSFHGKRAIVWYRISFHWQRYHIIETCPCSVAIEKVKLSLNLSCHQSVDSATHVSTHVFFMIPTATVALMRSGSSCSRPAGFLPTIRGF